jgi:hypothetical protein
MTEKFDGRLTAPLRDFLLHNSVARGVERGREPEGARGSVPAAALEALDVLALPTAPHWESAHDQPGIIKQ